MANNPVYIRIDSLPTSSTGKTRVMTFHLDDNHDVLNQLVEVLTAATYKNGGATKQGATTLSGTDFTISNHAGITLDLTGGIYIATATVSVAGVPDGKHRIVAVLSPTTTTKNYTDPETGETINHDMPTGIGVLNIATGDATNYPTLSGNVVPIVKFEMASGAVTTWSMDQDYTVKTWAVDAHENAVNPHPIYQRITSGTTAGRPASPSTGEMYFDTDLGKPVWWDGTGWVDATGTAV